MPVATVPNAVFLQDFGVPVVWGAINATGILDMPSQIIDGGMVISTDYKLTFATADLLGLDTDDALTVDGTAYTVRDVRIMSDGVFSEAILSKV